MVADALSAYADALAANPVPTKVLTAATLVMLGDAFSQLTSTEGKDFKYDWNRGLSFAAFGAIYTGAFQHWWFLFLNEAVPVAPYASDIQLWLAAATKTCLCQFGTIPLVYLPLFFLLTGLLRGLTFEQTLARAQESYLPLFGRNITYWIPVQMAQFLLVDPEWQVPYVCSAGFIWSIFLSQLTGPIKEADTVSDLPAKPDRRPVAHSQVPELLEYHTKGKVLLGGVQVRLHVEHLPDDEKAASMMSGLAPLAVTASDRRAEVPAVLELVASEAD